MFNDRFVEMKKDAERRGVNYILDHSFFSKIVRQHIDGVKITKKHNDYFVRVRVANDAANFAERCCAAPQRRENRQYFVK